MNDYFADQADQLEVKSRQPTMTDFLVAQAGQLGTKSLQRRLEMAQRQAAMLRTPPPPITNPNAPKVEPTPAPAVVPWTPARGRFAAPGRQNGMVPVLPRAPSLQWASVVTPGGTIARFNPRTGEVA